MVLILHLLALAGVSTARVLFRDVNAKNRCANPVQRTEWRDLSTTEKRSYIDSVLCLKTEPSRLGLNTTLFDDFAYVHHKLSAQGKTSHRD